ncbi:MAG TPA: cytochrome B, partial [Sedimenticola sp.]|nr:cytochrome B [Sedimenticola sp.]
SGVALDAAENRAGPLAGYPLYFYGDLIGEIHEAATTLLEILVPLHLIGVFVSSRLHRENLVRAMITGRKPE